MNISNGKISVTRKGKRKEKEGSPCINRGKTNSLNELNFQQHPSTLQGHDGTVYFSKFCLFILQN